MAVSTRQLGRWTVMEVSGGLHPGRGPPIRAVLDDLIDSGVTSVLVDLAAVRWIDAVGLAVLTGGHRRLHAQGGQLRVSAPSWPIRVRPRQDSRCWCRCTTRSRQQPLTRCGTPGCA